MIEDGAIDVPIATIQPEVLTCMLKGMDNDGVVRPLESMYEIAADIRKDLGNGITLLRKVPLLHSWTGNPC